MPQTLKQILQGWNNNAATCPNMTLQRCPSAPLPLDASSALARHPVEPLVSADFCSCYTGHGNFMHNSHPHLCGNCLFCIILCKCMKSRFGTNWNLRIWYDRGHSHYSKHEGFSAQPAEEWMFSRTCTKYTAAVQSHRSMCYTHTFTKLQSEVRVEELCSERQTYAAASGQV